MSDWKKDKKANVDKGPGSKGRTGADGGSGAGREHGPAVKAVDGGSGRNTASSAGAQATEKTRNAEFAKGGKTHMFGEQEAGSRVGADKSPSTGKPDSHGPGQEFASGGKNKMFGYAGALPATAGITAPRES